MPVSIGMWLWQVRKCEDGNIAAIVQRCQDVGLGHVLIKTNDGRGESNGTLGPLVDALHDAGINVWAWQYTYGRFPEQEAEAFQERTTALAVNGLCVNAEVEYKGNPQAAERYMAALTTSLPTALSSFYRPRNHGTFPWKEFLSRCTWGMPQVYWHGNDPALALQWARFEYQKWNQRIIATGATYQPATGEPRNILEFLQACEAYGIAQANFWSWQHCTPAMWQVLMDYRQGV